MLSLHHLKNQPVLFSSMIWLVNMADARIKVVLLERNPLISKVLQQSLRAHFSSIKFQVTLANGVELQKLAFSALEQLVFVIDEPSLTTYQMLRIISQRFPESRRIILGHHFEVPQLFSLILEGAHGFLTYEEVKQKLGRVITAISQGHLWLQPGKSEDVCLYLQEMWQSKGRTHLKFTKRQKQIIDLVNHKLSNKEIASQLCISENTVKFHLGKVFSKVGTRSRESVPDLLKLTGT
jgi:DNA-binding NarL/FixJ family response regulator